MERRVLLAIFLAFLVLYAWQALFVKPVPRPGTAGSTQTSAAARGVNPAATSPTSPAAPLAAPSLPAAPAAAPLVSDSTERDVRVETRDVIAVFTNRGARLNSRPLKRPLTPAQHPHHP